MGVNTDLDENRVMLEVAPFAIGFVAGVSVGRWAALAIAPVLGVAVWIVFPQDFEVSDFLIGFIAGAVAAVGVAAGVLARGAARELRGEGRR